MNSESKRQLYLALCNYLPHELEVSLYGEIYKLAGVEHQRYIRCYLNHKEIPQPKINSEIHSIKPILHPLSDLKKEIERLKSEYFNYFNIPSSEDKWQSIERDLITISGVKEIPNTLKLFLIENLPRWVTEKLLEWHFDVFGLIEKGYAVDINKLSEKIKPN